MLYLCNVKQKQNHLTPKPTDKKGTKTMKTKKTTNDYSIYNQVITVKGRRNDEHLVILVRNGLFYESYEEDADVLSEVLGVGQFYRKDCLLKIAGFGCERLSSNLPKILRAGHRVAIMDAIA